jgi:hypothetical protein
MEHPMYGSIAYNRLKPGMADEFARFIEEGGGPADAGDSLVAVFVYRMDSDPDDVWVAAVAESREAWQARSADPAVSARFQRIREFMMGDPEWHDGEVIFSRLQGADPGAKVKEAAQEVGQKAREAAHDVREKAKGLMGKIRHKEP